MIESMTGYGAAEHVEDGVSYALEARSVNHRYLKLSIKLPELLQFAERVAEKVIRSRLARGSVSCTLRMRSEGGGNIIPIAVETLQRYVDQLGQVRLPATVRATIDLGAMTALPGVCQPPEPEDEVRQRQLEIVEDLAARAMDSLLAMRREEGRALHDALLECCGAIRAELAGIVEHAPKVIEEYHDRLKARVEVLMQNGGFELEADGLMREVAIYAERTDIAEEATRMTSHLDQFAGLCDPGECVGRTLDFLTQELLREANTIASKSNNAAITRGVIQIKGHIDRIKEQVQNVQ